jgi:hypothetical protein
MKRSPADLAQTFESLVRSEFGFLEEELGLKFSGTEVHIPEIWTTFRGRSASVVVTLEMGAPPWVEIAFPDPTPDFTGAVVRTSVGVLLDLVAPGVRGKVPEIERVDDPRLQEVLHRHAAALRQYGIPVLLGDSDLRARLRQRQRELAADLDIAWIKPDAYDL